MDCNDDEKSSKTSPPASLGKNKPKPTAPAKEISAGTAHKPSGAPISNRFSALARTPPSKPKGNDGAAG
jgi:hypothetical protein